MMNASRLALMLVAAVALTGCAKPPAEDLDTAAQAMDAARIAQATEYAPQEWNQVQDAKARLDAELKAQEEKMALFRSYSEAKALASEVTVAAQRANEAAVAGKQRTRDEAAALMEQARHEAELAKQAIENAPRGKGAAADLASLRADGESVESILGEMQSAFDAEDYLGAKARAEAAIATAQRIRQEIEEARELQRRARRA